MEKFEYPTIEQKRCEITHKIEFAVYGHGEYEESSVLAGQRKRVFLAIYPTIEEAQGEFPGAETSGCTKSELNLDYLPDRDGVPFGDNA